MFYSGAISWLIPNAIASDKESRLRRTIMLKNENRVNIKINFGAGTINILPAGGDTLLDALMYYIEPQDEPEINYYVQGDKSFLDISSLKDNEKDEDENNINITSFDDLKKNKWNIRISKKVLLKIQIEMGAAKSDFDFGGMSLSGLKIECGASDTKINFSEKNPVKMGTLTIKAGVSKIRGMNFLNANFKKFKFEGGVGMYNFKMGEKIRRNAEIELSLGGASAIIELNEETPFILKINDSFLSSIRVENAEKKGDYYKSYNYHENANYLDINTDIGIGVFKLLVGK